MEGSQASERRSAAEPTAPATGSGAAKVRSLLSSPILGIAPWILMSVLAGPGRFELAAGLALALSVAVAIAGRAVGLSVKLLDLAGIVFFAVLLVIGLIISADERTWLDSWAGELSNIMLVVVAAGSMLIRTPFTLQYAREMVPRELWSNPGFIRTNYVITGVWAAAFLVAAISGFIGDTVLDDDNNIWTGWIIQIGAMVLAAKFTDWYPDHVRARAQALAAGDPPPRASVASLLIPLTAYLVPAGIVVLIFTGAPWWVGVGLIIAGAGLTNALHQQRSGDGEG